MKMKNLALFARAYSEIHTAFSVFSRFKEVGIVPFSVYFYDFGR